MPFVVREKATGLFLSIHRKDYYKKFVELDRARVFGRSGDAINAVKYVREKDEVEVLPVTVTIVE
jgi:hypothetical protein